MILNIDTSNSERIKVGVDKDIYETDSRRQKSQRLLSFIDEILKKKKVAIEEITEIRINPGPGSFTGLRVGMAVANALSWVLRIPVNGKKPFDGEFVEINYKAD